MLKSGHQEIPELLQDSAKNKSDTSHWLCDSPLIAYRTDRPRSHEAQTVCPRHRSSCCRCSGEAPVWRWSCSSRRAGHGVAAPGTC